MSLASPRPLEPLGEPAGLGGANGGRTRPQALLRCHPRLPIDGATAGEVVANSHGRQRSAL